MVLQSILILAILFWLAWLAIGRTIRRCQWLTIVLVAVPLLAFTYRWSLLREQRGEWSIAPGASLALWGAWWLALGRKLSPPQDDSIRVWTPWEPFE